MILAIPVPSPWTPLNPPPSPVPAAPGFKVMAQIKSPMTMTVAASGDLNCDGFADLILKGSDNSLYIVLGKQGGFSNFELPADKSNFIKIGGSARDGVSDFDTVKVLTDVSGDKCNDLVMGSTYSFGKTTKTITTAAYVIYGNTNLGNIENLSKMPLSQGFSVSESSRPMSYSADVRYVVAALGDVDKDGFSDFSIVRQDTKNGFFVFGRDIIKNPFPNMILEGFPRLWFKVPSVSYMTGLGDLNVNTDACSDIVLGVDSDLYIIYGRKVFTSFSTADARSPIGFKITGNGATINEVIPVGDVNKDGFGDFAISSSIGGTTSINIIFGAKTCPNLNLSNIPATAGIKLTGTNGKCGSIDTFHISGAPCDYNTDGIRDALILHCGASNKIDADVVFGKKGLGNLDLDKLDKSGATANLAAGIFCLEGICGSGLDDRYFAVGSKGDGDSTFITIYKFTGETSGINFIDLGDL